MRSRTEPIFLIFLIFLQYVDNFFPRMELLKTESASWDAEDYEKGVVQMLARGLEMRSSVVPAERSLRDALTAQKPDTHLSQGTLQTLKVRTA